MENEDVSGLQRCCSAHFAYFVSSLKSCESPRSRFNPKADCFFKLCASDPGHQRGDGGQQGEEVGQRRSAALVSDEDGRVSPSVPLLKVSYMTLRGL